MLYRRGYYPLALGIAKTQQLDDASIADIHLKTADALYNKKNYDDALTHYVQTIGHVQPSYVIRKVRLPSIRSRPHLRLASSSMLSAFTTS